MSIRQFAPGTLVSPADLPHSRLRSRLESLPNHARERALIWLRGVHFTELDLNSLHTDEEGGVYYADEFQPPPTFASPEPRSGIAQASLPVSPFPPELTFHSRPGSSNVLFINFTGEDVTGTAWNSSLGRTVIPALPFSSDSDYSTFSDSEQSFMRRVWQRVAEDYAPFDIDVTTERPTTFTSRTAHALVTRSTDANQQANPSSSAGGVAYTGVFASPTYANYRPAWIYHNNLGNLEYYTAEAVSHEVGHNFGLSHDGTKNGDEYYDGHGSGEISWGTIMGSSYGRNVTQWSRGEYYQANNTQDDLATIAAKVAYRLDDHGNTFASATKIVITDGTNIFSTTPETDPGNTNRLNKGVIERNTDVDVFYFATGTGSVDIRVDPWRMDSTWRGGNLDASLALYNSSGALIVSNNPALSLNARIQTNLSEGRYFIMVRGTGAGTPLNNPPTGYTGYGSLGQYFISGTVVPSTFVIPPSAELAITDVTSPVAGTKQFTVTYSDDASISVSSIDSSDIRITGPRNYDRLARFISLNGIGDGSPRVATYAIDPPSGSVWLPADNGFYSVWMQTNQVADTENAWVPPSRLGYFTVNVPTPIYQATMDSDPNWSLEPQWAYGTPNYASGGPTGGKTGARIIAYNLNGDYESFLPTKWATTPPINCSGASSLTLRFERWLRLRNGDSAVIQVSTNGFNWTNVWSTSKGISDQKWTDVQYPLPSWTAGSRSLRVRWGIGSGMPPNDIGWNIDDVSILAGANLDTQPPTASLSVANVTDYGSPTLDFNVTYSDNTAVNLSSLGSTDVLVIGPGGFTNNATLAGVDASSDVSPCVASYSLAAPGGSWSIEDNGVYEVILQEAEVSDTYGNFTRETTLGTFSVNITVMPVPVGLSVSANNPAWGSTSTAGGLYDPGTRVQVNAQPGSYFRFSHWGGDISTTDNPITLVMERDLSLVAVFQEMLTTNHPTPYWWLASVGYTNDFEGAANRMGANGFPVWESYIAGLDPNAPESQLRLESTLDAPSLVFRWQPVEGRVYSLLFSTNFAGPYSPLPGAENLSAATRSFKFSPPPEPAYYYRIAVGKP